MLTANEIRDSFVKFFESKGHQIVPSAPMVIKDDPTLMFTNAGMNQFKDIILGNHPAKYKRVTDSQKCLRVSGKHNDLEEVGHDTYHHTMFEMLGNWSFGDYFKKEAISWAYEYLVSVLKLDPKDLYVTVFEGSPSEGISRDDEAAGYWGQFFPEDHIINGNKHDNFWEMGDTGPCGPCSEIHIDSRSAEEKAAVRDVNWLTKIIRRLSKSGTWCSCSTTVRLTEHWNRFQQKLSIPVWDSNVWYVLCKARHPTTILTFSSLSSRQSAICLARSMATMKR